MAIQPYQSANPTPPPGGDARSRNGMLRNGTSRLPDVPQPIVIGQNLHKDFQLGDQWVHALRGVNVRIPQGQFICIMGPSGSGKSTLLYMLGGLDRPSSGEILVAGQRLDGMQSEDLARFRRETIGFIFQAFHLVPTLNAVENVALPGIFAGMPRDMREKRAIRLLEALNMQGRFDHRPHQLSGGQQQRVAIARALFNNPPIIMADEPTGALDSKTGQTVMELLRYLCRKRGKTLIIVTHDSGVASYADRLLHLRDGEIVDDDLVASNFEMQPGITITAPAAPLLNGHTANGQGVQNGAAAHGTNHPEAEPTDFELTPFADEMEDNEDTLHGFS